jgi:hypothetical protein
MRNVNNKNYEKLPQTEFQQYFHQFCYQFHNFNSHEDEVDTISLKKQFKKCFNHLSDGSWKLKIEIE